MILCFDCDVKSNPFYIYSRNDIKAMRIGSGSENLLTQEKRAVEKIVIHPKFSEETLDYDVAVVKVASPFVPSAVQKPIALVNPGEEPAAGEPVVVSGWGRNKVSVHSAGNFVESVLQVCLYADL